MAFHLPKCDRAQFAGVEQFQQAAAFLGDLSGKRGRWLRAGGLCKYVLIGKLGRVPCPAPLLPSLMTRQVNRLANRQDNEQLPEVIAVIEAREPAMLGPAAET